MTPWFSNISNYIRFVSNRSVDTRFEVMPVGNLLLTVVVPSVAIVVLAVLFADRPYLAGLQNGDLGRSEIFEFITLVGKSNWILILTGMIIVFMSFFTTNRFRGAARLMWQRVFLNAYYLFTTVAFSGLLTLLFKQVFARTRPEFIEGLSIWQTSHFADAYAFASFPSGHSTTAGAMAVGLGLLFPRFFWFFVLAGIVIAISRPAIGVHFPSDAIAGFLFGAVFSWYYARSFARKRLLFTFKENGGIKLRGEGKSHMGLLGSGR